MMLSVNNRPLYLGLDIGTSGVRGICIDNKLEIHATASASIKETHRSALRNPLTWKALLIQVLTDLAKEIKLENIEAISVDGQSGTVLLCNAKGELFAETSLLYNDSPSAETIEYLKNTVGACPATLGRAFELWNILEKPAEFYIAHQADWIAGLFCDRFNQSDENNALKMGYSPLTRRWNFAEDKLPFSAKALPIVSTPSSLIGKAKSQFSNDMGLSENCRIVAGTTDGTAGFIAASGLHGLSEGTAVTSLGTTLVIKTVSQRDIESIKYGVYSHKLLDIWVAGGASNSGAGVLLDFFTPEEMNKLSKEIDPAVPSPLKYYPLLVKGERFPVNDLQKTSLIEPRPEDNAEFLAGLFESIANIEKQAYETLDKLGAPYPQVIKTVGGGSYNKIWTKIRKRVLNTDVMTAEHPDAAYGAALIAQFSNLKGISI